MISQEKMYEVLFDNKEYVYFIISKHFKKAEPNEKTYKTMLKNNIYFKYLCSLTPELKKERESVIATLNGIKNKYWLKKENYAFLLMLKAIKHRTITITQALKIMPTFKIVNGFYEYLLLLDEKTKIKNNKLERLAQIFEEEGVESLISIMLKQNLVH